MAVFGPAGAGKSSLVNAVAKKVGLPADTARLSFAAPLKGAVTAAEMALGLPPTNWLVYEQKAKMRPLMVEMGRMARSREADFFAGRLVENVDHPRCPQIVLVDDLRYLNEYDFIRNAGCLILPVKVARAGRAPANAEEAESLAELDAAFPKMQMALAVPEWDNTDELDSHAEQLAILLKAHASQRRNAV